MRDLFEHPLIQGALASLVAAVVTVAAAAVRNLWNGADAAKAAAKAEAGRQAERLMELAVLSVEEHAAHVAKSGVDLSSSDKREAAIRGYFSSQGQDMAKLQPREHDEAYRLLQATLARIPGVGATGIRVHAPPAH